MKCFALHNKQFDLPCIFSEVTVEVANFVSNVHVAVPSQHSLNGSIRCTMRLRPHDALVAENWIAPLQKKTYHMVSEINLRSKRSNSLDWLSTFAA